MTSLRMDIIPTLESAGLITREKDKSDSRKEIIFITEFKDVSELENNSDATRGVKDDDTKNNSDDNGGVKDDDESTE
jgi:hypothetical protein